jgi:hypothetical protein
MGKVIEHEHEYEYEYENKREELLWAMRMRVAGRPLARTSRASKIRDAPAP